MVVNRDVIYRKEVMMHAIFDYERILYELKLISHNLYWNDDSMYRTINKYAIEIKYKY